MGIYGGPQATAIQQGDAMSGLVPDPTSTQFDWSQRMIYTGNISAPATPGSIGTYYGLGAGDKPSVVETTPGGIGTREVPGTPTFGRGAPYTPARTENYATAGKNIYGDRPDNGYGAPMGIPGTPIQYEKKTIGQFVADWGLRGKDDIAKLQQELVAANALQPGSFMGSIFDDATRNALFRLATYVSYQNDPHITVESYLAQAADYNRKMAASRAGTSIRTTSEVDLHTPLAAKGIATSALQSALGRDPTPEEFAQFQKSLAAADTANPVVTKTTTTTDGTVDPVNGGLKVTDEHAVKSGGVDLNAEKALTDAQVKAAPDYHAVTAVKYAEALASMSGAVNSAGTSTGGV